jgi:hypothetical protein
MLQAIPSLPLWRAILARELPNTAWQMSGGLLVLCCFVGTLKVAAASSEDAVHEERRDTIYFCIAAVGLAIALASARMVQGRCLGAQRTASASSLEAGANVLQASIHLTCCTVLFLIFCQGLPPASFQSIGSTSTLHTRYVYCVFERMHVLK